MDLSRISDTLEAAHDSRDRILTGSRPVISGCSRAILLIHRGRILEAGAILEKAGNTLESLRKLATPRTQHYMIPPEQEYVEARALLEIAGGRDIPGQDTLGVMSESYVLGLMDLVGELKRLLLDQIRAGKPRSAASTFDIMEDLYHELYPFATYDKVLKESRRKLDVCRIIMDDARHIITQECRRQDTP